MLQVVIFQIMLAKLWAVPDGLGPFLDHHPDLSFHSQLRGIAEQWVPFGAQSNHLKLLTTVVCGGTAQPSFSAGSVTESLRSHLHLHLRDAP